MSRRRTGLPRLVPWITCAASAATLLIAGPAAGAAPGLTVSSSPPGATVYLEGGWTGLTPDSVPASALQPLLARRNRKANVYAELAEHAVQEKSVPLFANDPQTVAFKLEPQTWCDVVRPPQDVEVKRRVPHGWAGWTPRMPPGRIELSLTKGVFAPQTVVLDAPSGGRVAVPVGAWRHRDAVLDLTRVPPSTVVTLNGKPVATGTRLAPGAYALLLRPSGAKERVWNIEVTESTRRVRHPGVMRPSPPLDAALKWLVDHQEEDGRWDAAAVAKRCACDEGTPRCVALTSLATLALLGAPDDAPELVRKARAAAAHRAAKWLATHDGQQKPTTEAMLRFQAHERALVAWALAEGFGATGDESLREQLQTAVRRLHEAQNPYLAWRYGLRDGDNDTTVTSFTMLALQAAHHADADVDAGAFKGALDWLDKMTDPESGQTGYQQRGGGFAYKRADPGDRRAREDPLDLTNTTLAACARLAAWDAAPPGSAHAVTLAEHLKAAKLVVWSPMDPTPGELDLLYLWFGARLLQRHRTGGRDAWGPRDARWSVLQETAGHAAGSFHPVDRWSRDGYGGRIYATAVMALALESASLE